MKRNYETPQVEVVKFQYKDQVVAQSGSWCSAKATMIPTIPAAFAKILKHNITRINAKMVPLRMQQEKRKRQHMKKQYETPSVEVVKFQYSDQVVAKSGGCAIVYRLSGYPCTNPTPVRPLN